MHRLSNVFVTSGGGVLKNNGCSPLECLIAGGQQELLQSISPPYFGAYFSSEGPVYVFKQSVFLASNDKNDRNIFHFIYFCLPRIKVAIERLGVRKIFFSYRTTVQRDLLSLLYSDVEIIDSVKVGGSNFLFHDVFIATNAYPLLQGLEDHPLTRAFEVKASNIDRIYVSRADAQTRRVVNERELFKFLDEYNFSIYHFSELPLKEQISLMLGCREFVFSHGAAGAFIPLLPAGASVIELVGHKTCPPFFRDLCALFGKNHQVLVGETTPNGTNDIYIDPLSLEKVLCKIDNR